VDVDALDGTVGERIDDRLPTARRVGESPVVGTLGRVHDESLVLEGRATETVGRSVPAEQAIPDYPAEFLHTAGWPRLRI